MTLEYLLEAYTRKTGNKINALSNKAIKAIIEKARKSMIMSNNTGEDEILKSIIDIFKTAKNGYDIFLSWWLYSSYKLKNSGTKKTLSAQLPVKTEKLKVNMYVNDPSITKIHGQCYMGVVDIWLPMLQTTPFAIQKLLQNKSSVQEKLLKIRTVLSHEIRHYFQTSEELQSYRGTEDSDWKNLPLPANYAYAMYFFQPTELEARYEEAEKMYREKHKKQTVNQNILTYFVNIIYNNFHLKPRAFLKGEFGVGMSPVESTLLKWTILVWLPDYSPKVTQTKQWQLYYNKNKNSIPLLNHKVKLMNQIADKVIDNEFTKIERAMYILDVADTFDCGDEWYDDPEFEKEFCSLSGLKKFLKCLG